MTAALAGLTTGLSLIVAIGAQNAYVLRQGLLRQHVGVVVAICIGADALLIVSGVGGVGALLQEHDTATRIVTWLGAAYLLAFGLSSLRRAWRPQVLSPASTDTRGLAAIVSTTLMLTFLNPHVYLDTVLMLGTIADHHGPSGRWAFCAGAVTASVLWFSGLGFGAGALSDLVARPWTWRVIDSVIGVVMLALAFVLVRM